MSLAINSRSFAAIVGLIISYRNLSPNGCEVARFQLRGAQAAGLSVAGWPGRQLSRQRIALAFW
jgi:hypothetical protein